MGAQWTERHLPLILNHLMDLVGNPRSSMTNMDAIYSRKCVACIFQASIVGLLTEKAQLVAGQELLSILYKSATAPDVAAAEAGGSAETKGGDSKQHVLVRSSTLMSCLTRFFLRQWQCLSAENFRLILFPREFSSTLCRGFIARVNFTVKTEQLKVKNPRFLAKLFGTITLTILSLKFASQTLRSWKLKTTLRNSN